MRLVTRTERAVARVKEIRTWTGSTVGQAYRAMSDAEAVAAVVAAGEVPKLPCDECGNDECDALVRLGDPEPDDYDMRYLYLCVMCLHRAGLLVLP